MRTSFLLILCGLGFSFNAFTQQLYMVSFSGGQELGSFAFKTDQNIIIKVSPDGNLLEWGMEQERLRYNYYPGRLDPFMGRVDYYGPEGDSISRGKVKSIGTCMIRYYGAYEVPEKRGKLQSLGSVQFDYYTQYDNESTRGKIRSTNNVMFTWYTSFENEAYRGKLKSVNNTNITYYSSFDDKLVRGKIKSIGNVPYKWGTSLDRAGSSYANTYPALIQNINGVNYLMQ
jgi:hypothetical protein